MLLRVLLALTIAAPAAAQSANQWTWSQMFTFEYSLPGEPPDGWGASSDNTQIADCQTAHTGSCSARIVRTESTAGAYSYMTTGNAFHPSGQRLQLSAWVKTSGVAGYAAIYLGEQGASDNNLQFASTQSLNVQGTHDWTQYTVSIPVAAQAVGLYVGFMLGGTGTAWIDDIQLTLDGQSLASAIPSGFTSDHQFDNGSGISLTDLTDVQVQNLVVLAKVWGFLKYYHPLLTGGQRNWDYELFRVLPAVLAATGSANQVIADWINTRLGAPPPCSPCATLDTRNLYLGTHLDWIARLDGLSPTLLSVFANRTPQSKQSFFVSFEFTDNPTFQFESFYPNLTLPDSGYQLLGLFRAWNAVEYFYPNRDIMSDDPVSAPDYWDNVLQQYIRPFATAQNPTSYLQTLLAFKTNLHDSHSGISNFEFARPPLGSCRLPVQIRFVEGSPVVTGYLSATGATSLLEIGDVIQRLDGIPVSDLISQWTPYYTASNQAVLGRDMSNQFTVGSCGPASVTVLRGDQQLTFTPSRVATSGLNLSSGGQADLPGAPFQMLFGNIAYLKLSNVVAAQSADYVRQAASAKGLIVDIRNYPSQFVIFTLGDLFTSKPVDFVQFTQGDATTPGAIHWITPPVGLTPASPHYNGKVVVLVNELTQSQAEYTAMSFRAAGAKIVGSTTAGADGNVSMVPLPGGYYFYYSGLGVFYPDHRPTQRVGIVPDVVVTPTIAGIRAGRDEVLDAAIQLLKTKPGRRPPAH